MVTMKMYVFVLRQLSHRDQGIQACHAVCELIRKYRDCSNMLDEWLHDHKTLVYLNGGGPKDLIDIFNSIPSIYPTAYFTEPDLNGMVTAVAALVPAFVPNGAGSTIVEHIFREKLSTYQLA
jgi:hypothetical protein